jgi:hypothetical protein
MAFVRRKTWEQERMALAMVGILGMANVESAHAPVPRRVSGHRWLDAPALLAEMGVKLQ